MGKCYTIELVAEKTGKTKVSAYRNSFVWVNLIPYYTLFQMIKQLKGWRSMEKRKRKVNIVDVIIILVILAVAVFFAYKFLGGKGKLAPKSQITYTVLVQAVPKDEYENVIKYVPDKAISSGNVIECEVKSVTATPCKVDKIEKTNTDAFVKAVVIPDGQYVDLTFTLTAQVTSTSLLTEVGTQEVRVGRTHIIKTKNFELTGAIITLDRS
jgi:hypothetical protein